MLTDRPPTVLVADDDLDLLELTAHGLRLAGLEVLCASDGCEALALYDEHHPQLMLLDWAMPGLTGTEVCATVRGERQDRTTPILIASALGAHRAREALERGADEFLNKPVPLRVLRETVTRLLQGPRS